MPAWSKFRFSKERARWPSITGYVPIPVQNRTSISLDLAYSSIEETTGTSGTIAQIMRWAAPTSESFRDWYTSDDAGSGTDAEAYLVTGYMTGGDSARNKFLPWLTIHCSREGLRGEVASESATASTTPTATVTDSFSTNLILLIHANTADVMGQDHSGWNHPIQRIGSTSYETTLFKYGNGSYHFGSASYSSVVTLSSNHKPSYGLAWPQHSVMNSMCGQNKFTIEWWSYRTVPASLPTSKAYPPVSGGIGALVDRYNVWEAFNGLVGNPTVTESLICFPIDYIAGKTNQWQLYFYNNFELSSTFDASLGSDIYYSVDTNTVLSEILRFGYYTSGGATLKELDWTLTLDNDVWNHFALCRSSAMYSLFKNGVLVGVTKTSSGSIMFGNGNMQGRLWVGALVSTDSSTASLGYCYTAGRYNKIDELRITGQVARYTSAFTPPAGPFPDGDSK